MAHPFLGFSITSVGFFMCPLVIPCLAWAGIHFTWTPNIPNGYIRLKSITFFLDNLHFDLNNTLHTCLPIEYVFRKQIFWTCVPKRSGDKGARSWHTMRHLWKPVPTTPQKMYQTELWGSLSNEYFSAMCQMPVSQETLFVVECSMSFWSSLLLCPCAPSHTDTKPLHLSLTTNDERWRLPLWQQVT